MQTSAEMFITRRTLQEALEEMPEETRVLAELVDTLYLAVVLFVKLTWKIPFYISRIILIYI